MTKNEILASIIIPVYNVELYLKECLDSIFVYQKISHKIEVIIVNDGSTDGSLNILKEYKKQHDFILIDQESSGPGGARNAGIKIAKGKYLLFVDSDDYFIPYTLDKLLKYLAEKDADLIEFEYEVFNQAGHVFNPRKRAPSVVSGPGQNVFCTWEKEGFYSSVVWTKAVSREMVISNQLYFCPGIYQEDLEWSPKVFAYAESVCYLPFAFYVYRIRDGSITAKRTPKHYMDLMVVFDRLNEFSCSGDFSPGYIKALRRNLSSLYFNLIKELKIPGGYNQYLISALEKRKDIIKFSSCFHRKYFYRYIIYVLGIKNFYILKYGFKNFFSG